MVVILAAAYPGLHTPSLRLPYLYANSGGLQMKRGEGENLSGASLQQIINYADTFLSLRNWACQTMCWGGRGRGGGTGLLRKLENSTTALSPCVWQDKADSSCSNNHTGRAKTWNLPITSLTINNLLFAMNLVQINREDGERPRSQHNVESELAGEEGRLHTIPGSSVWIQYILLCSLALSGPTLVSILSRVKFRWHFPITQPASGNELPKLPTNCML